MTEDPADPIGILLIASVARDEFPWLYEIAVELYRAVTSGDERAAERELKRLRQLRELLTRAPLMEEIGGKETHMLLMELPHAIEHLARRHFLSRKNSPRLKAKKTDSEG